MRFGFRCSRLLAGILPKISLSGWAAALFTAALLAVPASPDPIKLKHPNGTTTLARMAGDEFQGWIETLDGYTVVQNPLSGAWEYAVLDRKSGTVLPSGYAIHLQPEAPAFLEKHVKPARNIDYEKDASALLRETKRARLGLSPHAGSPNLGLSDPENATVAGTKKLLIVLVNFQDRALITTAAGWNATIFQTGAGVKSVRQFYLDNSFGTLDIQPVPSSQSGNPQGIVTVSIALNHPNYGKTYDMTTESGWLNLALAQAAPFVDFAALDTNGNGVITPDEAAIYFIPAGYENSGSTQTPNIWAHAWGGSLMVGPKTVSRWAMNGELNDSNHQHPMGAIAHELGHSLMGLPDLYNTNSATSDSNSGLGRFSLMAGGSWGRDLAVTEDSGATPVALDAWCRESLGWITPQAPTVHGQPVSLTAGSSPGAVAAKLLNAATSTAEYFLVENRFPSQWDRGLTRWFGTAWGGGLLVLHIDNLTASNAYSGSGHQKVMAEHANNAAYGTSGTAASLFYAGNATAFTPTTLPASTYYDGQSSTIGLVNASAPGATMTFDFLKITDTTAPTGKPGAPSAITDLDTMTFTWSAGDAADPETGLGGYRLQVGTTPGGSDVFSGGVGTALSKTILYLGLKDGVLLYGSVAAMNGAGQVGAFSDSSAGLAISLPVFDGSAVDNAALPFKTIGPWSVDTTTFSTGTSSARSAVIGDDGHTYLQSRLTGPGTLTFDWRTVSEPAYDHLTFSLDGVDQAGPISGTTGFASKSYSIPAGSHVARWTYAKDENTAPANDGAWVDHVQWAPGPVAALSLDPVAATLLPGASTTFTASGDLGGGVDWTISPSLVKVDQGLGTTVTAPATASMATTTYTLTATDKLDASMKATATLTVKGMDLVADGLLNPLDLLGFAAEWGKGASSPANFKGTGMVDDTDLAALLNQIK